MGKLWEKGYEFDALIERFTVGEDYLLDRVLLAADCVASMAHAKMLESIGILSEDEERDIHRELGRIIQENEAGSFKIQREDEDCHTAVENRLTEALGEAGKKVHTGRSRNDQVLAAIRLYTKSYLMSIMESVLALAEKFFSLAGKHQSVPMAGRTHLQAGMPSSIGLWAASYGEELLDAYQLLEAAFHLNDQCPLGSAAGYGVPLPLDREMTARLLGFDRVQNNVLAVQNSRGRIEAAVLQAVEMAMMVLSKASGDMILFSLPEFGYFSLPEELCSGSSIMPQKRNPDVLELIRSKTAVVGGLAEQVKNIIRSLYSGYNRDFQDTKGPLLKGLELGFITFKAMEITLEKLEIIPENCRRSLPPEIFATDDVMNLVHEGKSFRDAYQLVAAGIEKIRQTDPEEAIQSRNAKGMPGNLAIETKIEEGKNRGQYLSKRKSAFQRKIAELAGFFTKIH